MIIVRNDHQELCERSKACAKRLVRKVFSAKWAVTILIWSLGGIHKKSNIEYPKQKYYHHNTERNVVAQFFLTTGLFNPFTPMSVQSRISPYNINRI